MFSTTEACGLSLRASCMVLALFPAGCSGGVSTDEANIDASSFAVKKTSVDIRRSLIVTEQPILQRFSLERVLEQLVSQSGVSNVTALSLFQQWWDTQNPKKDPADTRPHCDDFVDATLGTVLNGYPYLCRPAPSEGGQSECDPFSPESLCAYIPIGLTNRFDLAPADGSHCGEYRIVFAKQSGVATINNRNLLIFEAVMPNPHPQQGLKGCRKIVDVWADLSKEEDLEARADALEAFYFDGQGNVPPVISIEHFGDNERGLGQVRTNQFALTTSGWSLREFKLLRRADNSGNATLLFVPQTNKENAFGRLFDPASTHANAGAFREFFPTQVASLAASTISGIKLVVPDQFNTGQSQASGTTADEMRYLDRLGPGESPLRSAIQKELDLLGSTLSVNDIVLRAQAMSCAGCHRLNSDRPIGGNLTWPASNGFVHISEREPEVVDGVTRFQISKALQDEFLPARQAILEAYLRKNQDDPVSE